jgi:hypothetical protein
MTVKTTSRNSRAEERDLRRRKVATRHLQGQSQVDIARELKVSRHTVQRDLQHVVREWKATTLRDFDDAIRRELLKLDLIEYEAWCEWNKSRTPQVIAEMTSRGGVESSRRRIVQRNGDPRFLAIISRCSAERRKILKLDKHDPGAEKRDAKLDPALSRLRVLETFSILFERERAVPAVAGPDAGQPLLLCPADEHRTLEADASPGAPRSDDPGSP